MKLYQTYKFLSVLYAKMSDIEQDVEDHDAYYAEYIITEDPDDEYYDDYDDDYNYDNDRNYDVEAFDYIVAENSLYKHLIAETKSYLNYSYHRSWCSESYFKFLCKSAMILQVQKKQFDWSCCSAGDHRQQLALLGHHNFWSSTIHKNCHSYDKSIIITLLLCGNRYSLYLPNEMWLKIFSFLEV